MNNMFNPYAMNYPQSYPQFPQQEKQQPITQNFQLASPMGQSDMFMARFLKDNERAEDLFVNSKTAFIDLKNKELKIKELDGRIETFGLIPPKDDKDIMIEDLQRQIYELKGAMTDAKPTNANVKSTAKSTK